MSSSVAHPEGPQELPIDAGDLLALPLPAVTDTLPVLLRRIRGGSLNYDSMAALAGQEPILAMQIIRDANRAIRSEDPLVHALPQAIALLGESHVEKLASALRPTGSPAPSCLELGLGLSRFAAALNRVLSEDHFADRRDEIQWCTLLWSAPFWPLLASMDEADWRNLVAGQQIGQMLRRIPSHWSFGPVQLWRKGCEVLGLPELVRRCGPGCDPETVRSFERWRSLASGRNAGQRPSSSEMRRWLLQPEWLILLSNRLAWSALSGWGGRDTLETLQLLSLHTGRTMADLAGLAHQTAVATQRTLDLRGSRALCHRLLEPVAWDVPEIAELINQSPEKIAQAIAPRVEMEPLPFSITRTLRTPTVTQHPLTPAEEEVHTQAGQLKDEDVQALVTTRLTNEASTAAQKRATAIDEARAKDTPPAFAPNVVPEPETEPESSPEPELIPQPESKPAPATEQLAEPAPGPAPQAELAPEPEPEAESETAPTPDADQPANVPAQVQAPLASPARPNAGPIQRRGSREVFNLLCEQMRSDPGSFENMQGLAETATRCLTEGIGLQCGSLLTLDTGGMALRTFAARVLDDRPALQQVSIPLRDSPLILKLLKKQASVWVDPKKAQRLKEQLPLPLLKASRTPDFFLMSCFVRSRPVAMLYGDGGPGVSNLTDYEYEGFKQACSAASHVLYYLALQKAKERRQ